MPGYSDLQTLFNNNMGSFAAIQAGQLQGQQQQAADLEAEKQKQEIQRMLLANQQSKAMNPLDQMFRQQQVEQMKAQTPGLEAQSGMLQSQNRVQQGTETQQMAAKLSQLSTQIGEEGMKQMGTDGQKLVQASAMLSGVPPLMMPAALKKVISQYGLKEDNPLVAPLLQTQPENIVPALKKVGESMAMASSQYISQAALAKQAEDARMAQLKEQNKSQEKIAGGNNSTALEVARMNNSARLEAAKAAAAARQAVQNTKMTTDQKIAALTSIPEAEKTDDDRRQLYELSQQRLAERSAGANGLPAQMVGATTPQQAAAQSSPFAQGQQPVATKPAGGLKQIGTSGGKPVYQDAQGNRFIGK